MLDVIVAGTARRGAVGTFPRADVEYLCVNERARANRLRDLLPTAAVHRA